MRENSKMLAGFLFLVTSWMNSGSQSVDVQHYRFNLELNDRNDSIFGRAEITVRFLEAVDLVEFDLIQPKANGKGMFASKASGTHVSGMTRQPERDKIQVAVAGKKGDTATIVVSYKGIPADGLIISKNKYGARTFFADNWPNRGRNWLPCVDDPADKASVEFIVTAPQHYQVVANGIQIEESNLQGNRKLTHWKEDVLLSTKIMVIGVAGFAVNLAGMVDNCIPVYSWVYPEDKKNGFYDYAQAAEILPFFIKNVGPYAYKKLANVESKTIFGGLENANTIFYSEKSIDGKRGSESLLAHEIAHQWFGNMATEKSFAHLWLSEGFATYMTILYMENKYGWDTAVKMLTDDRLQAIDHSLNNATPVVDYNPDYMQLLNPNSYQKGGWILHMLRRQLGDSVFWKSIRKYYSTYAGKTADTDDLRKIFEEVSGKDLQYFFRQWLFRPGHPALNASWKYLPGESKLLITVEQRQKGETFRFPLEISWTNNQGKEISETLNISKATEIYKIHAKEKPGRIKLDPRTSLLFEGKIVEMR